MEQRLIPTEFAPAERCDQDEIKRQTALFASAQPVNFVDYVPDIVLVLNQCRQVVFTNKTATGMIATTDITSVYGMRVGEIWNCIHADETEGGCGTTQFCRECGAVKAILSSLRGEEDVQECMITQKDSGDAIVLRVWTYPVTIENEELVIFIAVDIGDEKRRRVLERIFLHDIMNTVGNIRSFAEILKEAETDDAEEFREIIYDLSKRLIDEINAQRELSAAEHHELTAHPGEIDPLDLLEEVRDYYAKAEIGKDFRLEIDEGSDNPTFTSDRVLIGRVLGNMVKNALEASVAGDTITLSVKQDGEHVAFSVHNPGYIPPEVQLQIFQRSFSTKGTGRGLGTYGMRLLSERYLQGKVSFTSDETTGTTFTGRYPVTLR